MKFSPLFNEYIFNNLKSNFEKIVYQIKIRIIPLEIVFFLWMKLKWKKEKKLPIFRVNIFLFDIIIVSDFRFQMKICRNSRWVLFEQIFPPKINQTQFGTNQFQNLIFLSDFHIHFWLLRTGYIWLLRVRKLLSGEHGRRFM